MPFVAVTTGSTAGAATATVETGPLSTANFDIKKNAVRARASRAGLGPASPLEILAHGGRLGTFTPASTFAAVLQKRTAHGGGGHSQRKTAPQNYSSTEERNAL